jgi:hypothetical protein
MKTMAKPSKHDWSRFDAMNARRTLKQFWLRHRQAEGPLRA